MFVEYVLVINGGLVLKINSIIQVNPYISQLSPIFKEGVEGGFFIKRLDGSPWQLRRFSQQVSSACMLTSNQQMGFMATWTRHCRRDKSCCAQMVQRQTYCALGPRCRLL